MYQNKKAGTIGIIITIIILILIVIFSNGENNTSFFENAASNLVMPIQNGLTYLKNKISGNNTFFTDINNLQQENEELKARILPPVRSPFGVWGRWRRSHFSSREMAFPIQITGWGIFSGSPSRQSSRNPHRTAVQIMLPSYPSRLPALPCGCTALHLLAARYGPYARCPGRLPAHSPRHWARTSGSNRDGASRTVP